MTRRFTITLLLALCLGLPSFGQTPFQNLDFESASLPPIGVGEYGPDVPVSQGLPGWTVQFGSSTWTTVKHNNWNPGTACVCIIGPDWTADIIEGNYSCFLSTGSDPVSDPTKTVDATIRQAGLVPANTQSLQFKARIAGFPNPPSKPFGVYLSGQELSLRPLLVTSGYTLYGADVSRFSGTQAELRITAFWINQPNGLWLDSISFSPDPVPEPSTWVLVTLGTGLVVVAKRKRAKPRVR